LGLGTAINVAAVLVGGGIGTLAGAKLPEGMRATGGVPIVGLGLGLLDLKRVRVGNMLPALLFTPLLVAAAPLCPF
jgi:uncharacterized membrane protein YqgA involved in biofilm formation